MSIEKKAVKNEIIKKVKSGNFIPFFTLLIISLPAICGNPREMKYTSRSANGAEKWQIEVRSEITGLLNIDDLVNTPRKPALDPKEISSEINGNYIQKEMEISSTPGRRIRVILTIPSGFRKPCPAVVCIHGHSGKPGSVYDKGSIYKGFAAELAAENYVTVAPVVSQHTVYEKDRTLMGERLWDVMRCVDFLESLDAVDKNRIGCAGLSLGGEMAMWLGAMDTRIKATLSSGFLTVMDQLEHNHCMCWKFPGLRDLVDWADVYSLVAPRALLCQNGLKEPEHAFIVPLAKEAFKEIKVIYTDYGHPGNIKLIVHKGAHEIDLKSLLNFLKREL